MQREELRKEKLTLLFSALPVRDMRRVAFISTMGSHTAKAFLASWPDGDFNLPTDAWHMAFCACLGLKVPFLKKFVGRLIGTSATARVDAHGMALASAKLPGDHWRIRHDVVKHAISFTVRGMGIAVNCEVYNLFATAFSPAAAQHFTGPDSFGRCKGLVPGFELKFNPRELGGQGHRCWQGPMRQQAPPGGGEGLFSLSMPSRLVLRRSSESTRGRRPPRTPSSTARCPGRKDPLQQSWRPLGRCRR